MEGVWKVFAKFMGLLGKLAAAAIERPDADPAELLSGLGVD